MKKTLTLLIIASVILISVGCQKEDLPVMSADCNNASSSSKALRNNEIRNSDVSADKKIQNVVACKACHAYKDAIVQ